MKRFGCIPLYFTLVSFGLLCTHFISPKWEFLLNMITIPTVLYFARLEDCAWQLCIGSKEKWKGSSFLCSQHFRWCLVRKSYHSYLLPSRTKGRFLNLHSGLQTCLLPLTLHVFGIKIIFTLLERQYFGRLAGHFKYLFSYWPSQTFQVSLF